MIKVGLIVLALVVASVGYAMAEVVAVGPPTDESGSWTQNWVDNGNWGGFDQPYNRIVITMSTGTIETIQINTDGWTVAGSEASMAGTFFGNLDFSTTFEGNSSETVSFAYDAYYNDILLGTQDLTWSESSGSWSDPLTYSVSVGVTAPEPAFASLLIIGCLGAGLAGLRRKNSTGV